MSERKGHFGYEELLACGRGELFGPGNAQLPLPPMLMFDRINEISESGGTHDKGCIRAEFSIKEDLWFFPCHFQGDPVMPGCLYSACPDSFYRGNFFRCSQSPTAIKLNRVILLITNAL